MKQKGWSVTGIISILGSAPGGRVGIMKLNKV